jgi:cell division protein FtsL
VSTSEFLIAASREREYDWVLLPTFISQKERSVVMKQLPSRVHPETQIIEATCGDKRLWVAIRIEYTSDGSGRPLLDHAGRELRHSYGVVSNERTTLVDANSAIDSILPKIKNSLADFLGSSTYSERIIQQPDVNAQFLSNIRSVQGQLVTVQGELTAIRTSLFVMRVVTGLAIILGFVSVAYAYYSSRTVSDLSQRIEEHGKKMVDYEKKVQEIDAKLAPTNGVK